MGETPLFFIITCVETSQPPYVVEYTNVLVLAPANSVEFPSAYSD